MTTPGIFGENIFLTGKYNETLAIQDNFSTTSVSIPRTLFIGSGNDTFLVYGNIINRGLKITTTDYTRFDSFTITFSIKPLTFNVRLYKYIGGSNSTKYETNELINQSFTYDPPISNTPVTFNFTSSPVLYPGTYAIVLFSTSDTSINVSARIRFLDTNLPSTFISGTYTVNESILAINGNTTTEDLNRWYLFYDPVFRDISGVGFKELTANNITFNTLGNTLFTNNINMNNNSITNINQINGSTYPPNLANVLDASNIASTNINMNNNNIINVGNINLNTINSISFINNIVNGNGFAQSNVNVPIFTFPDSVASYSAKITYYWIDTVAGDDIPRQGVGYVSFRKKIGVIPSTTIPDTFVKTNWLFDGLNNGLIQYWTLTSYGLTFPRINQPSTFPAILISAEIQKTTY
jgi:hypothetical protein